MKKEDEYQTRSIVPSDNNCCAAAVRGIIPGIKNTLADTAEAT